jgi:hypothetical protein
MSKTVEVTVPFLLREDKNGDDYYVCHPMSVPFEVDLANYVMFFFPPDESSKTGKLLLRPANADNGKRPDDKEAKSAG